MHGLVNKAIECFVRDTHGSAAWQDVVEASQCPVPHFEPMLSYDNRLTGQCLEASADLLGCSAEALAEDIGTYLVSHDTTDAVRRLLRFGGVSYSDFLASLEDLPARARLALPDLTVPSIRLEETGENVYFLSVGPGLPFFGHVMLGILRALADDYGALVVLEHGGQGAGWERISIEVHETEFASGRSFALSAGRSA